MQTILRNAFVYTGDPAHRCIEKGALLLSGDRIDWVGPEADLPLGLDASARDLGGRVVIPGLINTHAHGGLSLHRGYCDDGDLFAWAAALAPTTSQLTLEDNRWGCYLAAFEMVRNGITTACDCARYGAGIFSSVASAIGMRSLSGSLANSPSLRTSGQPNWPAALEETKEAIQQRSGDGLSRFYLGAHSPYNCTPELLTAVKEAADGIGVPFVIHVAENRRELEIVQERHGRRPIDHLRHLGLLDRKSILAHCVWLNEEEIGILASSGAGVAHNPISNGKLASGVAPIPQLRRRGVAVGLGTDSTLSNNCLSIFQEMKFAVLMQRVTSLDGHALTARDALSMATREGARVLGWEADIGSLEAGKEADLVILELDHPLGLTPERVISDLVYAAGPHNIRSVMVKGRAIFEDGKFTLIDEAEIKGQIRNRYGRR
ncbi:MAG: amidohydrolase [Proteobacteria bacterium]|nr:amidohydrolase [Pseudomonadota bacterium]